MFNSPFFKRIVPFILTFAFGLLVASFFVNILPSFKFRKGRYGKRHEIRKCYYENEQLRLENLRLKQRLAENDRIFLLEAPVPPPPPMAPSVNEMPVDEAPRAR